MIPEKLRQILESEGAVAIATQGEGGPHLVNTWHSYLEITPEGHLIYPAGGMKETEDNVARDPRVLMTMGGRGVAGFNGPGAGFLVTGRAEFVTSGPHFAAIKTRFPWARAAVVVVPDSITQTL